MKLLILLDAWILFGPSYFTKSLIDVTVISTAFCCCSDRLNIFAKFFSSGYFAKQWVAFL
jgi:hypothetical protein